MTTLPFVTADRLSDFQKRDAQAALDAATQRVRDYCGWHIAPVATDTITCYGPGTDRLLLPTLKLVELVSVTVDGVALDLTTVRRDQAGVLSPKPGSDPSWLSSDKELVITFKHGHGDGAPAVADVIAGLASRANPTGVLRQQAGPFSAAYAGAGYSDDDLAVLSHYALPGRV